MAVQLQPCTKLRKTQQTRRGQGVVEWVGHGDQQQVDMSGEQRQLLFGCIAKRALVADDYREASGAQHFAISQYNESYVVNSGVDSGGGRVCR